MSNLEPTHALSADQHQEFVQLLVKHQRRLYRYILTLLPNSRDAEDVLQETASLLWKKFRDFERGSNFYAWACRTAEFKVREHRRRITAEEAILAPDVFDRIVRAQSRSEDLLETRRRALSFCLAKLPPSDRELVRKCYEDRYGGGKAVAAALNRPANSVYQSLGRIRAALLQCINRAISSGASLDGGGEL